MKKKYSLFIIVLLIIAAAVLFIFKNASDQKYSTEKNRKLKVIASIYPLYFFSSQIGGDKASVLNLTPAGVEPHDYEPSTQDIARIESSNLLVLNGGVEAWGDKIKNSLTGTNVKVVASGQGLITRTDPHVWLDPELAKKEAGAITQGFISIDPQNSVYYQDNENKLYDKLDRLDSAFRQGLRSCERRDFITSHAAFAFLAKRYGLTQVAISGLSPDQEPSAKQLTDIVKFARENNVKYIFFETLVSPKLSETIANEIGAKTLVLDPIEGISDDDIKQGENYFTVMENNLKNLQIALQCSK